MAVKKGRLGASFSFCPRSIPPGFSHIRARRYQSWQRTKVYIHPAKCSVVLLQTYLLAGKVASTRMNTLKGFWLIPPAANSLLKIVVSEGMASSSAGKRRSARTDSSLVRVCATLPQANRVFLRINTLRIKTRFLNKADSVYSLPRISALK